MHSYGVRDVEKLLRLPRSTIRALVAAGFVAPARGPRRSWRFSFQDLIVLRTAQALVAARVPARRITHSLKKLREQLPDGAALSGLAIGAEGRRVVVRDGAARRQADSGQYLLAFEGDPGTGALGVIARQPVQPTATAADWFERALALEDTDAGAALEAYAQAVAANPRRLEAHINLGRLLHEAGRLPEAEQAYRAGLAACGEGPVLQFNLGVLLEDLGRPQEAGAAYQAALRRDPTLADAHYNLALLCEKLKRPREALRHMAQYRRLMASLPR